MHFRVRSVWPLPIIPKLLSFRLEALGLGQYLSLASCPRREHTKERVRSRWTNDALIKNYHPTTTKGPLARFTLLVSLALSLSSSPSIAPPPRPPAPLFAVTSPYLSPRCLPRKAKRFRCAAPSGPELSRRIKS